MPWSAHAWTMESFPIDPEVMALASEAARRARCKAFVVPSSKAASVPTR